MRIKGILTFSIIITIFTSIAFALTHTSANYTLSNARIIVSGGTANSTNYQSRNVRIGNAYGGKAESANYSLDATNIDKSHPLDPPNPPTLNPVTSPTNVSMQTLSGTKEQNTSIYINGYQAVPITNETIWTYDVTLSEGNNDLVITARNQYGLESDLVFINIFLDTSKPTTPIVADDGVYTSSTTQLHASWTSEDLQTGIVEYQYAIGTAVFDTDIADWTSIGTQTEVTHSGLSLTQGQTYYFSVKAKNSTGSWSQIGSSDGIEVNQHIPSIIDVQPPDGSTGYTEDNVTFTVNAEDPDEDDLLYQFSLDGQIIQPWQSSPNFDWSTSGTSLGIHTMKVEVRDGSGGEASQDVGLCLFRKPPEPPMP